VTVRRDFLGYDQYRGSSTSQRVVGEVGRAYPAGTLHACHDITGMGQGSSSGSKSKGVPGSCLASAPTAHLQQGARGGKPCCLGLSSRADLSNSNR
jgi:hypothetical protein